MKHVIFIFAFCFGLFCLQNQANAQLGGSLLKKAVENSNSLLNKNNQKNEQPAPENQQKEEQAAPQEEPNQAEQANDEINTAAINFFMPGKNIPIENSYSFTSKISMDMVSFDASQNKEETVTYTVHFNNSGNNFGTMFRSNNNGTQTTSLLIGDYKNLAFLMLSDDGSGKSGIVMPLDTTGTGTAPEKELTAEEQKELKNAMNILYNKTGKTKEIMGLSCEEYVVEDSASISSVWMSKNLDASLWGAFAKINNRSNYNFLAPYGFMLQIETRDKNSKSWWKYTMKEISANAPASFDVSQYQLIHMGNTQPKKE